MTEDKSVHIIQTNGHGESISLDIDGPLISIITPARNSASTVEKCLTSLLEQNYPRNEIILVDDGSTDNTAKIAESLGAKVLRIDHKPGALVSRPLQIGIDNSSGEVIAFVQSDAYYSLGYVREAAKSLHDPMVGGVVGPVRLWGPRSVLGRIHSMNYRYNENHPERIKSGIERDRIGPAVFKRELLEELPYGVGGIELEIGKMIKSRGKRVVYNPRMVYYHQYRTDLGVFLRQKFRDGAFHRIAGKEKTYYLMVLVSMLPMMGLLVSLAIWRTRLLLPSLLLLLALIYVLHSTRMLNLLSTREDHSDISTVMVYPIINTLIRSTQAFGYVFGLRHKDKQEVHREHRGTR